jgi:hypothetical protein
MEHAALANKPDFSLSIRNDLSDPANKLASAVIAVMSKCSGPWIKLVEAAGFGAKPKTAAIVSGNARNVSAGNTIRVLGIMKIAGKAFNSRVESVHPSVGGDPQIAVIIFHQRLNKIGTLASGVVGVVLVHDEGITVIAIEAISRGKPHEAAAILQNGSYIALRQAIVRGQVRELEVPHISMAGLKSQSGRPEQEREGTNCDERQRSFHLRPRPTSLQWYSRMNLPASQQQQSG